MIKEHVELRKLQMIQYSMLKRVDQICWENNIDYYLMYGTLLGAVRHQASIPWDTDIDIAMNREEFYKFQKAFKSSVKDLELWDICYSSIEYAGLSRVIKPNDENFGNVHVDIFILDYAKEYSKFGFKIVASLGRFLHIAKLSKNEKRILRKHFVGNKKKLAIIWLGELFCKVFSNARIEKWNYKLFVSEKPTTNYIILEDLRILMKTDYYSEKILLKYEDMEFSSPNGFDELLKLWYGNYMEIPKEGKEYLRKEGINE